MRQLKNLMKAKKPMWRCGECKCVTLQAWKCADEFCGCWEATDDTLYFTGYSFIMPGTNKTWYFAPHNDNIQFTDGTTSIFIVENWSSISPTMIKDYIITDSESYYIFMELAYDVADNIDEYWPDAKTVISEEDKAIIVNAFNQLTSQIVYFNWDWVTYQNDKTTMPLYNVEDYFGKKLWTQSMVETNWKFAILWGNAWTTYTNLMTELIAQWEGVMKVPYPFSATIREGLALDNIPSKGDLWASGYDCIVDSPSNLKFTLNLTDLVPWTWVLSATAWDKLPWVTEGTSVSLSSELADAIIGDWDGWIYLTADTADWVEVELTNAP